MAERSAISQAVQIGPEVTYGVAVTADTRLTALQIMPSPDIDFERFRGAANKFNALAVVTRNATAVDIPDSPLTYTEAPYPFSSLMGAAAITTPAGATNARQHEYIVSATGADNPVSFTVQRGDGTLREAFAGFVVNSLDVTMEVGAGVSMSGDGFGTQMVHSAAALDALAGTQPGLIPVVPTTISVYMDPLPGTLNEANIDSALGTTKLTRVFAANPSFGNRYSRVYALDAAVAGSSVATVEIPVEFQLEIQMEADAVGWGLMTAAQNATPQLIRIEAIGAQVDTGVAGSEYRFTLDMFGIIADGGDVDERDGVEQITWVFDMMYSPEWTKAMRLQLVNALAAL